MFMRVVHKRSVINLDLTWKQSFLIVLPIFVTMNCFCQLNILTTRCLANLCFNQCVFQIIFSSAAVSTFFCFLIDNFMFLLLSIAVLSTICLIKIFLTCHCFINKSIVYFNTLKFIKNISIFGKCAIKII